jgi:hypothetical protein
MSESQVPKSKYLAYQDLVKATKDVVGGQTTRGAITGKFSAALDNAQQANNTDPVKNKKDKVLKSEGLISANITNPSNNPIKKPEEDN